MLAVIVAVLLIAGTLLALNRAGDDDDVVAARDENRPASTTTSTTEAPGSSTTAATDESPAAKAIRQELPSLQLFVEQARGLRFKEAVDVELLSDEAFRQRIKDEEAEAEAEEDADKLAQESEDSEGIFRALGLIEGDIDLEAAGEELAGDAIAGFYDPETNELVVRGDELTPSVKITLVHELTHALQDQHFELHRPQLDDAEDESSSGFDGLVEGDAERIAEIYKGSLSPSERKQAEREEQEAAEGIGEDIPDVLLQLVYYPYFLGPIFVDAVVDAGGQTRLDAAFASPPSTTEHLLHPETFLSSDNPKDVDAPKADGESIDEGVFGELALILVLQKHVPGQDLAEAARGWGGDRYVAWKVDGGKKYCVRTTMVMDTQRDVEQLRAALDRWESANDGVDVKESGRSTTFTACG